MEGLVLWRVKQIEKIVRSEKNENSKRTIIKAETKSMEDFLNKISLPESQWHKPLEVKTGTDLDIVNPYGAVACWVLQLYSMELGSPPLYMELNRASREID